MQLSGGTLTIHMQDPGFCQHHNNRIKKQTKVNLLPSLRGATNSVYNIFHTHLSVKTIFIQMETCYA